jgi:hypothetical protein
VIPKLQGAVVLRRKKKGGPMRFPFNIVYVPRWGLSVHLDGYYGPCLIHIGPWLLNWRGRNRAEDEPGNCPF